MSKKIFSLLVIGTILAGGAPAAKAEGWREGASSLFLPTTGQAMNGEFNTRKTKMMGTVEVASIAAVTTLGIVTGGATVLWGAIPLAANHIWSATDAYKSARSKQQTPMQAGITYAPVAEPGQEMYSAQQTLEQSRQGRYDREQAYQSDFRDRMRQAAEQVNS